MATATASRTSAKLPESKNVGSALDRALTAGKGILRLSPTWVPRSFLHPGKRVRLHPDDYYSYGLNRGGIDERWFASTTEAANEGRVPDEGLSWCVFDGERFMLRDAVSEGGAKLVGKAIWDRYKKWPVYSKFFDNMGPIPHHMHQSFEDAKLVGQEGKPESYYFPPQYNNCDNHFPYTFMGLEPGTTKEDVRKCLENWNRGDNGIIDLAKAYRLERGTGWLIPPGVLHAPGSLLTYEPQWGSDVFSMFQSLVEGRAVPWSLLVKDMPKEKHHDLDFIIGQLDWEKNIDTHYKESNFLRPLVDEKRSGPGATDRWIVYGHVDGRQLFSAKELTLEPGAKITVNDAGASGWITVQGEGKVGVHDVATPTLIRFGQMTSDELFISADAAAAGYTVENTGPGPLVSLRYFGPDVHADLPKHGKKA
jgi:hypothetical protein